MPDLGTSMGEINIERGEREAIRRIDVEVLQALMDQCQRDGRSHSLRELRLEDCGTYVATKLRAYERALTDHAAAKTDKKREEAHYDIHVEGGKLVTAVQEMKHRLETEERDEQIFQIPDRVSPPVLFSEHLSVRVSYRWRRTTADEWKVGSITFLHDVDMRPDHTVPQPKRTPSAAQLADARRDMLHDKWEYLSKLALHAVKEFFRNGGDGGAIPEAFRARADAHSGGLNNHSADFWREKPRA